MSDQNLEILGRMIPPGESTRLELEIARLHTRSKMEVPIQIERSGVEGPVLLLIAGIHGDETNGVAIIREVIRSGINKPIRGTVISIPVYNVFGFLNQSRQLPDGKDMNRSFPGSENGSLASQFAYHLRTEIASLSDYVIDFHTGSAERHNVAQIRCDFTREGNLELAKAFCAPFVIHSKTIPKSFRETLTRLGKKSLLFEGGKTNSIDPDIVDTGVRGVRNIMHHLGMGSALDTGSENNESIVITKTKWLRASASGLFYHGDVNGKWVEKGDLLGFIKDPYGDYEKKVRSPKPGHIVCSNTAPIVNRGDALFHMSLE